ncbi:unnamed protein product [Paramecium sonneborni]|uniref:Uncharacterized protein n=1 Tax=Paramecium sonneborni TaxID=65129 RepID=A0A8S1QZN2_9CILI|nr:unnamed protein product [Paramecium sonneborni]
MICALNARYTLSIMFLAQEYCGIQWDYSRKPPLKKKTNFLISKINDKEIQYFKDGSIIRIDRITNTTDFKVFINFEQIQHFQWHGAYGLNNQRTGKWTATWQGESLLNVGGDYSNDGKKQGQWQEIIQNYCWYVKIYEIGEYKDDLRQGLWKFIQGDRTIGIGKYNELGLKNGKWKELSDKYCSQKQITFVGEYFNGIKIGRWDTVFNGNQIGGGSFNEKGQKIGLWIELSDGYYERSQVTYQGVYNGNTNKNVGRWEIKYGGEKQLKIGGGLYDAIGSIKIGRWTELHEGFDQDSQVTIVGEYTNGKKNGRWDIMFKKDASQTIQIIGGGSYDEEGLKVGSWIEIGDGLSRHCLVTQEGEYKKGTKIGRWYIMFKTDKNENFIQIGGGSYDGEGLKVGRWIEMGDGFGRDSLVTLKGDYQNGIKIGRWLIDYQYDMDYKNYQQRWEISELRNYGQSLQTIGGGVYECNGVKVGRWVELIDNFNDYFQVIYLGDYNNGQKRGRWDINWNKGERIGGGLYDDKEGNTLVKIGKWVELHEYFSEGDQVIYEGDYDMKGIKVGRWDIIVQEDRWRKKCQKIGGGSYDQDGIKIGRWVEFFGNTFKLRQVLYKGMYNPKGLKINRWEIEFQEKHIGGGSYDRQGQIKIGNWVELDERFGYYNKVTYGGKYNMNGLKEGRWDIYFCESDEEEYKQLGGGSYDYLEGNSTKIGKWVELDEGFWDSKKVIYDGEYNKNGMKAGRWDINYCKFNEKEYKQIKRECSGGGQYDQEGNQKKFGNWVELDEEFFDWVRVIWKGEYDKNGMKVGRWDINYCKYNEEKYQLIGGGSYVEKEGKIKIGMWGELHEKFFDHRYFVLYGEYNTNGIKVGRWDFLDLTNNNSICGCVNFDDDGNEIYRSEDQDIIYVGQFKKGGKIGRWDIMYMPFGVDLNTPIQYREPYRQIGGGYYDQGEIKIGRWKELHEVSQKITYEGEYNMKGKKVGRWDICSWKDSKMEKEQMIGGGSYDLEGTKFGKWIEVEQWSTFLGEYNMKGQKIGVWVELDRKNKKTSEKKYDN